MSQHNTESLASRFDAVSTEYQICRRKLESKCEALLILNRELDQCRSERDQFKLMAEQLRDRYQMVKRQLTGDVPMSATIEIDPKTYSDIQTQTLARMLFDTKEANKSLKFEVDTLHQKLQDAEGDIKLLREQIARSRVGTTDEGLTTRHFPAYEREELVCQLEASREAYVQLERDLQQVLDEKEELVTERAAYRAKYERLNTELNYILGGDEKRIVDIDVLIMENKFLQERLKQMEEEKTMALATVTKYKSILEKRKTKGTLKLGQYHSDGLVITQKQVQQIMQSKSSITSSPQALADLQGLCAALLDTINDKNLALSHQRKTNKLLGNRVNELEKKLKTLEVSGLWSVTGHFSNLEKLKAECEEIKTLVPHQLSQSTDTSSANNGSDFESSTVNSVNSSPSHQKLNQLTKLDLEELDLLAMKEKMSEQSSNRDLIIGSSETSTSLKDSALELSDVMEKDSGALRLALAEAMLKSLNCNAEHSSFDNLNFCSHDIDNTTDFLDCVDREAIVRKFLSSDDNVEDLGNYDSVGEDEEEEEASQEFEHLLESVTLKLLQRSQELTKNKPEVKIIKAQEKQGQVYITKDLNVVDCNNLYIHVDDCLALSSEVNCDQTSPYQKNNDLPLSDQCLVDPSLQLESPLDDICSLLHSDTSVADSNSTLAFLKCEQLDSAEICLFKNQDASLQNVSALSEVSSLIWEKMDAYPRVPAQHYEQCLCQPDVEHSTAKIESNHCNVGSLCSELKENYKKILAFQHSKHLLSETQNLVINKSLCHQTSQGILGHHSSTECDENTLCIAESVGCDPSSFTCHSSPNDELHSISSLEEKTLGKDLETCVKRNENENLCDTEGSVINSIQ